MASDTIKAQAARHQITPLVDSHFPMAVPTATGINAAGRVRGRAPAIHIRSPVGAGVPDLAGVSVTDDVETARSPEPAAPRRRSYLPDPLRSCRRASSRLLPAAEPPQGHRRPR